MALSFKEVAEILKIIDSSNCEELVLESEGTRLVIRRGSASAPDTTPSTNQVNLHPQQAASSSAVTESPAKPAPATTAKNAGSTSGAATENSPMVGTFYRRPSPDEAPYVEVGTKVSVGDPLCMIEVMKLYTTIAANVGGVVEAILVDDATLVEFDQPLFIIRPG
jgi:acetyl-CoA carboxylase biotin carboxyl carrier protein